MPYLTVEEFKKVLLEEPLDKVVEDVVFRGDAYAFRDCPEALQRLRQHVSASFPVAPDNIVVVGSAKMGFSLSPDAFPRQFSDASDIDVLVVDERLFDKAWQTLLKWNYPRRLAWGERPERKWIRSRQADVYWGWFQPDRIQFNGLSFSKDLAPLRDLSTQWFNAFHSLSRYQAFAQKEVSGWLYRSWRHALLYHVEGLRQIKKSLRNS